MPRYGAPYLGHKVTGPLSVTGYRPVKKKSAKKSKNSIYKAGYGDRTGKRKQRKYLPGDQDSLPAPSRRRRVPLPPDYEAPRAPSTRKRGRDEIDISHANRRKTAGDRAELYGSAGGNTALDFDDI